MKIDYTEDAKEEQKDAEAAAAAAAAKPKREEPVCLTTTQRVDLLRMDDSNCADPPFSL